MKLGTPLSPGATRVMLLGCGELGKEVIIALQRLGVEVIGVDRYADAPGQQVAHRAHVIDMTDGVALRRLVERERPHIIVPEIEAIATEALAAIEAEGLARVVPNARAVQLTTNREAMRRLAAEELGLPSSRYAFAESLEQLRAAVAEIGLPCIVKPVMSSSGKVRSVLHRPADVEPAWDLAASGGRAQRPRVIVEEMIDFDHEITLLTVRAPGDCGVPETFFCEPVGHRHIWWNLVASTRAPDDATRLAAGAGYRRGGDRKPGRLRRFRGRAVRKRRPGLVQRGQSATPRCRYGDHSEPVAKRVRAARPRHSRAAGIDPAGRHRRQRRDLRRAGWSRHRLCGGGGGLGGARERSAAVRQAGVFPAPPYGGRAVACRDFGRGPEPGPRGGRPGAPSGLIR